MWVRSLAQEDPLEEGNYLVVAVNVFLGVNASTLFFLFHSLLGTFPSSPSLLTLPSLSIGTTISIHSLFGSYPLPHLRWSSCDSWLWLSGSLPSLAFLGPCVISQASPGVRMKACSRVGMSCEGHWK